MAVEKTAQVTTVFVSERLCDGYREENLHSGEHCAVQCRLQNAASSRVLCLVV